MSFDWIYDHLGPGSDVAALMTAHAENQLCSACQDSMHAGRDQEVSWDGVLLERNLPSKKLEQLPLYDRSALKTLSSSIVKSATDL